MYQVIQQTQKILDSQMGIYFYILRKRFIGFFALEFMKDPDNVPHRSYFEAAQYYLNNDKDLDEAVALIDAALEKSPENFRYGLLKAKIQDKDGNREAAVITINQAHTWARNAKNANYIEQTELFRQSMLVGN